MNIQNGMFQLKTEVFLHDLGVINRPWVDDNRFRRRRVEENKPLTEKEMQKAFLGNKKK